MGLPNCLRSRAYSASGRDHSVRHAEQLRLRTRARAIRQQPAAARARSPEARRVCGDGRQADLGEPPGGVERRDGFPVGFGRPSRCSSGPDAPVAASAIASALIPAATLGVPADPSGRPTVETDQPSSVISSPPTAPSSRPWPGPRDAGQLGRRSHLRPPTGARGGRRSPRAARATTDRPASSSTTTSSTSPRPSPVGGGANRPGAPICASTFQRSRVRLGSPSGRSGGPSARRTSAEAALGLEHLALDRRRSVWHPGEERGTALGLPHRPHDPGSPSAAGEPEHALGHHVALDLVGPGVDRAGQGEEEPVEPSPGSAVVAEELGLVAEQRQRGARGWPGRSPTRRPCSSTPRARPRRRRGPGWPSSRCGAGRPRRRSRPGPRRRRTRPAPAGSAPARSAVERDQAAAASV